MFIITQNSVYDLSEDGDVQKMCSLAESSDNDPTSKGTLCMKDGLRVGSPVMFKNHAGEVRTSPVVALIQQGAVVFDHPSLIDAFRYAERSIFVWRMLDGNIQPFYRSLHGTDGKKQGDIYPFDGIDLTGWFIKDSYYGSLRIDDPGYGYGGLGERKEAAQIIAGVFRQNGDLYFDHLGSDEETNERLCANGAQLS